MAEKRNEKGSGDIYRLLLEVSQRKKRERRNRLLQSIGVHEFFEEGSIRVDMRTCKGVECKFCIEVCPTSALYWKFGKIGITEELCIYCTSCVLNCMVDDCIEVKRRRLNGENERFSNPLDVLKLLSNLNTRIRMERIKSIFPDQEAYINRYRKPLFSP